MCATKTIRLIALLAVLLPGLAWGQFDDTPPGINQLIGACNTASLTNMPAPISSAGSVGLACANHLYNWDAARVPHLRYALTQMAAGVRDVRIMHLGDSTTMGQGASTGTAGLTGAHALNVTSSLTKILQAMGLPAKSESVVFTNAVPNGATNYNAYDSRITDDGTWAAGLVAVAGELFHTTSSTGSFTFTPSLPFDTFDIYYARQSSGSVFTVATETGTVLTTTNNASTIFQKTTVTVPRGVHTLTITATGTNVYVGPIIPYDSTTQGIEVINGGISGAFTSTYNVTTNPWSPINSGAVSTFKPDAIIIELTINDANNAIAISTYITNLTAEITAYQAAGIDVILASGSPFNTGNSTKIAPEVAALYTLANSFNVPMIDLNARYVSYAYTNPIIPWFDNLHFTKNGYYDKALAYAGGYAQFLGSFPVSPALLAPTISSGFGTSPTPPTTSWKAFSVVIGSGGVSTSGILTMPVAPTGWSCMANDQTTPADITRQTASSTTSVTLTATIAWTAADTLLVNCQPY